mmetsp:Transcript_105936/g.228322  ORF Transcript_105936/g.228322 Transcript_105936/m.228322 type:complete len:278 (+) Transcript_105936:328-1161(+)
MAAVLRAPARADRLRGGVEPRLAAELRRGGRPQPRGGLQAPDGHLPGRVLLHPVLRHHPRGHAERAQGGHHQGPRGRRAGRGELGQGLRHPPRGCARRALRVGQRLGGGRLGAVAGRPDAGRHAPPVRRLGPLEDRAPAEDRRPAEIGGHGLAEVHGGGRGQRAPEGGLRAWRRRQRAQPGYGVPEVLAQAALRQVGPVPPLPLRRTCRQVEIMFHRLRPLLEAAPPRGAAAQPKGRSPAQLAQPLRARARGSSSSRSARMNAPRQSALCPAALPNA